MNFSLYITEKVNKYYRIAVEIKKQKVKAEQKMWIKSKKFCLETPV
jgi:hypothetical protein